LDKNGHFANSPESGAQSFDLSLLSGKYLDIGRWILPKLNLSYNNKELTIGDLIRKNHHDFWQRYSIDLKPQVEAIFF
jgi:hypothetical protein